MLYSGMEQSLVCVGHGAESDVCGHGAESDVWGMEQRLVY